MRKMMLAVATLGCFAATGIACADTVASSPRIGVVSFHEVMQKSKKAEHLQAEMQKRFAADQRKIEALQRELAELTGNLQRESAVMKASDKAALEASIEKKRQELGKRIGDFEQAAQQARQDMMEAVVKEIQSKVEIVAQKQSIDLVLAKEGVLFSLPQLDLTAAVEALVK